MATKSPKLVLEARGLHYPNGPRAHKNVGVLELLLIFPIRRRGRTCCSYLRIISSARMEIFRSSSLESTCNIRRRNGWRKKFLSGGQDLLNRAMELSDSKHPRCLMVSPGRRMAAWSMETKSYVSSSRIWAARLLVQGSDISLVSSLSLSHNSTI
ncbi:hypothetical protein VUR80DRAFT_4345 [Thermomyces stellatus]